jgi:toxin ParE1/3/4
VKRVRYHARARADYDQAASWYESRVTGLGDDFADAVERAEAMVAERPEAWPKWPTGAAGLDVRRCLLHGFPYGLVYMIHDDEVIVLAVAHQRRRPDYWRERLP